MIPIASIAASCAIHGIRGKASRCGFGGHTPTVGWRRFTAHWNHILIGICLRFRSGCLMRGLPVPYGWYAPHVTCYQALRELKELIESHDVGSSNTEVVETHQSLPKNGGSDAKLSKVASSQPAAGPRLMREQHRSPAIHPARSTASSSRGRETRRTCRLPLCSQ